MKEILIIFISIFSLGLFAQDEVISPLGANVNLYFQTMDYRNSMQKDFVEDNIVITADSISLPFIDDFSKNTLRPYDFVPTNIWDTIEVATGSCIDGRFTTESVNFQTSPSYYYFYDTINNQIDSIVLDTIKVYEYSGAVCFPNETSISNLWPSYYRSEISDFNTTTGEKLDSTLVTPDLTLDVAKIYFATMPKNVNWMDNYAWRNTTSAIDPITIGVATLDGLNEYGLPYNKTVTNAYGRADFMTSKPIDLTSLSMNDDVYLSFFYQAGGMGDSPNPEDSLVVEFKGTDGEWVRKWSVQGTTSTDFRQAYVPIFQNSLDSLIYSNSEFQFRFKNFASLSGNNDWWNIDYVRLDKNRLPNTIDSVIRDVAMLYDFPSYLENYTMLPWKQMQAGADNFIDEISIPIRDNGQVEGLVAGNFPLNISVTNSINADIVYSETGSSFNTVLGEEIKNHDVAPFTDFTLPTINNSDSVHFYSELNIAATTSNLLLANDTIKSDILFHNIIAYDDGSAEKAYGLAGGGIEVKKFAYEFNIATQDTLAAIQIHFSNIDENVDNLVFSLYAWDSLKTQSEYENIIGSIDNKKPEYIDYKNGFATFVFDTPIIVNNKFYIGWAQSENQNLQIGYDVNSTRGKEHMYIFTSNFWKKSSISLEGSPMIRAILDGNYPIPNPTAINQFQKTKTVKVYPNPTSNILNIDLSENIESYLVSVLDFTGKVLVQEENIKQIDVSSFRSGMYLLQIVEEKTSRKYISKFIVK